MTERLPAGPGDEDRVPSARSSQHFAPQAEAFEGDQLYLKDTWAVLKRRRWTILLAVAAVLACAALYTIWVTPTWYAKTLIRVDAPKQNELMTPAVTALVGLPGTGSQIETEQRILATRPIAEEVVDRHDLNFVVTDPREIPRQRLFTAVDFGRETVRAEYEIRPIGDGRYQIRSTEGLPEPLRREFAPGDRVELPGGSFVLANLRERVDRDGKPVPLEIDVETLLFQEAVEEYFEEGVSIGRPHREASVLQVGYRSSDRTLVRDVPNTHATAFIERRIESKKAEARNTVVFLEDQVEETREQLEEVESQLADFREGEQIVSVEAEAAAQVERMATLQTRRTQLDAERSALRQLLADIDRDAENPDYRRLASFPTFFQNQAVAGMLSSLIQADSARSALLARMTPSHPDVIAVEERIDQLEAQLGSIGRNYLGSLSDQIAALDTVLAQFGSELEAVPERQIEFARIKRQVDMLAELYTVLQTRLKEGQVQEAIDDSSVQIVEEAIEPLEPESPKPVRNLAIAMVLGLALGVVLAFVREYMDRRLHSSDRIETLFGLPTMARIPAMTLDSGRDDPKRALIALEERPSPGAESFRNLRTNIRFMRQSDEAELIVITSPSTNEGKSLTAANLAIAMAQKGRRTLLVDTDMRRSVQHEQFDVPRTPGLSEYLLGDEPADGAIRSTMLDTLFVLPAGHPPPNPAELLDSEPMDRLLGTLRSTFDAVIFDSPPVLAVTDSAVLAPKCDGVILVVRTEKTDKEAIDLAIRQLRQVDAEILGVVVNDTKAEGAYESYYREYYGESRPRGLKRLIERVRGAFS